MRNLCVSCSLVCLILLAASIFVFWVGIIQKQVPPVFVVSVLYILAGNDVRYILLKNSTITKNGLTFRNTGASVKMNSKWLRVGGGRREPKSLKNLNVFKTVYTSIF